MKHSTDKPCSNTRHHPKEALVRERMEHWLMRRGSGGCREICAASGISPNWLTQFRKGASVGASFVYGIEEFLNTQPPTTGDKTMTTKKDLDATSLLSQELRFLADALDSPSLSKRLKAERFRYKIGELNAIMDNLVKSIEKPINSGD